MADQVKLDPQTFDRLRTLTTATVTMQLLKRGIRRVAMSGVKPLIKGQGVTVGEAFTLRFLPMREDLSGPEVLGAPDYATRSAIDALTPNSFARWASLMAHFPFIISAYTMTPVVAQHADFTSVPKGSGLRLM